MQTMKRVSKITDTLLHINLNNNMIYYIRDENGELIGLKYNEKIYFYKKNYQGDIIGIYDSNYNLIVNYKYDSWGNIISITDDNGNNITDTNNIGIINPFRYRSYYYDTETKLYYLNSRYYNPLWGRFINADILLFQDSSSTLGMNLYIYCNNNPTNNSDSNGQFVNKIWKSVKKRASKVINTVKDFISDPIGTIKKTFTIGIDLGVGIGTKNNIITSEASKTFGFGYTNGKTYTSTSRSVGVGVSLEGNISLKTSYDMTHYTSIDGKEHINADIATHTNPMQFFWQIKDCDYTSVTKQTGFDKENSGYSLADEGSIFIGIDMSIFCGFGFKFKIGFNI